MISPSVIERDSSSSLRASSGISVNALPTDLDSSLQSKKRLEAVVRTGLLDTPPEEGFDRLTKLAAKLIGVPVAFISLVDEERDYYKSAVGLDSHLTAKRELQGRTFCHYAVASGAPLIIDDTLRSPDFREVPTIQSLGVRAYAGIPLITDDGQAIGSFCAVDFAPREWSPLEIEILTELAASALREIKLREAVAEAQTQTRLAQKATRSREEVLAVVAHDLRTPLNFIKMGTQLVAEEPGAKENGEMLQRMQASADLMNFLIEDLLEVAKMESGQITIHPKPLSAQTLVKDALKMSEHLARGRGIRLISECEAGLPPVLADYERILRVLSNLIVNAVKFTPSSGSVRITAARQAGTVCFSIVDSGPGIPPESLERIFDRFWQANSADRRGVGLGLAIAKAIVTAHGGRIGVASTVGHGSDFHFDLPLA